MADLRPPSLCSACRAAGSRCEGGQVLCGLIAQVFINPQDLAAPEGETIRLGEWVRQGRQRTALPLNVASHAYPDYGLIGSLPGAQSTGKKVLATIFEACPLVTFRPGIYHGLLCGSHSPAGACPHSYPPMIPRLDSLSMYSQKVSVEGTSVKVSMPCGGVSVKPAALLAILASCPLVTGNSALKHGEV